MTLKASSPLLSAAFLLSLAATSGCAATTHPVGPAPLGTPSRGHVVDTLASTPGPIVVETVVGARWHVPLSGLLNLEHPKAKAAGKRDGEESIVVTFHAIHHPTRGLFLVDTGVERDLFEAPYDAAVRGLVATVMRVDQMERVMDTASWIARQSRPVAGVFLTHLHPDHITGLRDVPDAARVFVGPGEAQHRTAEGIFLYETTGAALAGKPPLAEWRFQPDPDGFFAGIVDVFGDGSFFALHVPGHTPGSTAYLARTPKGPVLLTGDASHTAWGWENGVEPGTFSSDVPASAVSLSKLRAFVARHPETDVRVGHQQREPAAPRWKGAGPQAAGRASPTGLAH